MSKIDQNKWLGAVHLMLKQGYGVEDIALKLNTNVENIRLEVNSLRDLGVLETAFLPEEKSE